MSSRSGKQHDTNNAVWFLVMPVSVGLTHRAQLGKTFQRAGRAPAQVSVQEIEQTSQKSISVNELDH